MSVSPIYAHPLLYSAAMRALYGRRFQLRYSTLAELIPDGADVFEACAGDAYLFRQHLKPRGIRYRGSDLSPVFVAHGRARGIDLVRHDLAREPVPRADFVILQASLYQFMPDPTSVVEKLLAAARVRLLVAEPIANLASSRNALVRWLARRAVNPGDGHKPARFDEAALDAFFDRGFGERIERRIVVPGGREKIYSLRPR